MTVASTCPTDALAAPAGQGDGRFALQAALASRAQPEAAAFVTVAREAARQGRPRDAEVAWLAACHVAERATGSQSAPVADLKSEIGQHYVALAAAEQADDRREHLLQRAATLLAESANAYAAALGRDASKTRMAQQRLASVRDPATLHAARAAFDVRSPTSVMGAAAPTSDEAAASPGGCNGSAARRLVCSDPELAQLEHDLQRLRSQAASVSRDPAGLQRRDAQAAALRDSGCQDKSCLLRWYSQRRKQLLDEFRAS